MARTATITLAVITGAAEEAVLAAILHSQQAVVSDRGSDNNSGDQGDRGRCSIIGHENIRHDWRGCHLNLHSRRFNSGAGQDFYKNHAHGPNV